MNKKSYSILAVAIAGSMSLAACGGGSSDDKGSSSEGGGKGGTLYYLSKRPAEHLDPQRMYIGRDIADMGRLTYRSLVQMPVTEDAAKADGRKIKVGKVEVGGDAPISVQSMTTTPTTDINATLQQIAELTASGCDIVRVACPSQDDADALAEIAQHSQIPVIADIHFQPKYVFQAIEAGCAAVRVNPGNIPGGEKGYFDLLNRLSEAGLVGMSTPEEMISFGAKDALVKLNGTNLVPDDTAAYYDVDDFHDTFPTSLSYGERVLKQNRGSTGSGIWRVRLADTSLAESAEPGTALPLDTKLKCTEAVDNHTEERELGEFMDFCDQYIVGDNGMLVDMRFMPRIVEGEIRILLVGPHPVFVVHKKPAEGGDAFSATLFSGAKYTYQKPEEWQELVDMFAEARPVIAENLGGDNIPLIGVDVC